MEVVITIFSSNNIQHESDTIMSLSLVNLSVAFLAGLISLLSPCVMPIIPGFLVYLASVGVKRDNKAG